jgi:glycosyltransferase involved in cell wall biosynthesis
MDENQGNALQLSVVLATYNRAETVRRTLDHLAKQDLDPRAFEVIAIDDGSPDHTERVIAEIKAQVPFELSYMRHENRGPGFTQNRGIRVARAPICPMADDIFSRPARSRLPAHT